jgi:GNAT superfamily N-acetyltransferase
MEHTARPATLDEIGPWRERHREELACLIVRDSIHERPGWSIEYLLSADGVPAGYGSIAVGGPWQGQPAVYEMYLLPTHRTEAMELFGVLLEASGASGIEAQTTDVLLTTMLHAFTTRSSVESLLFRDDRPTRLAPQGAVFRHPTPSEALGLEPGELRWQGVVEVDGAVVASGGILRHYNPPYADLHMRVEEQYRRQGLGSFLVQELKRVCRDAGLVPTARCAPANLPSRMTLQRAGFAPYGQILSGPLPSRGGDTSPVGPVEV